MDEQASLGGRHMSGVDRAVFTTDTRFLALLVNSGFKCGVYLNRTAELDPRAHLQSHAIRMRCDPLHFDSETDRDRRNKAKPSAANRHAAQVPVLDQARGARVGPTGRESLSRFGGTFVTRDALRPGCQWQPRAKLVATGAR